MAAEHHQMNAWTLTGPVRVQLQLADGQTLEVEAARVTLTPLAGTEPILARQVQHGAQAPRLSWADDPPAPADEPPPASDGAS